MGEGLSEWIGNSSIGSVGISSEAVSNRCPVGRAEHAGSFAHRELSVQSSSDMCERYPQMSMPTQAGRMAATPMRRCS